MPLIDFAALHNAPLHREPFDYLVVPGIIPPAQLARINADYPGIDSAANHALDNLAFGPAFGALMDELRGPRFAAAMGEKFAMELAALPTTVTVRKYCERTDGNIHTDHRSKVLTVLVYFNEAWPHAAGRLRLLRNRHDIDDYVAEVPPLGGTLLAFRRTPHSWHGHTRFVGERRMIQLNYLDQSPVAVAAQRISRFGTHFMKNVLGMR